jgi:hypothetical protein
MLQHDCYNAVFLLSCTMQHNNAQAVAAHGDSRGCCSYCFTWQPNNTLHSQAKLLTAAAAVSPGNSSPYILLCAGQGLSSSLLLLPATRHTYLQQGSRSA